MNDSDCDVRCFDDVNMSILVAAVCAVCTAAAAICCDIYIAVAFCVLYFVIVSRELYVLLVLCVFRVLMLWSMVFRFRIDEMRFGFQNFVSFF